MKKLLFSAIALVAFSGVSIGNSISVETNQTKEDAAGTVSCRRTVTTTCSDGSVSTHTQTATVPSTGDYEVDRGNACAAASKKANALSAAGCS